MRIAILGEGVEFVALLSVFNPYLLVTDGAGQGQARVQVDIVCSQLLHKFGIASEIIIMIADHHCHLNARAGDRELIENGLVCRYDVRKPFDPTNEREFPESERVTDDQQFSVGAFLFQLLEKFLPPEKWSSLRYGFGQMEDARMSRKRHTPEEIVAKLRQVDVLTAQGRPVAEAIRSIGVTEVTYYRWRSEYGGLKGDQVKRLKELEAENARLRRAVSDLTLEKLILKEAAAGNL